MPNKLALYPGTFDPITNGHVDIIKRTLRQYSSVIVAVSDHARKTPLFTVEERVQMVKDALSGIEDGNKVEVRPFTNLVADFAKSVGAHAIIRGLRVSSDFEYEFRMNRFITKQVPEIELVYFMATKDTLHISSSAIRELASLNGDVSSYVPAHVVPKLQEKSHV